MAQKTVHLIRHAESEHNKNAAKQRAETGKMVDPLLWDCEVSDNGHLQIENLNKKIKEMGLTPDVVLISPLTRALTTAIGGFQHHMQPNGQIRFVVHPLLAERVENACDLGTPKPQLLSKFHSHVEIIDFSYLEKEIWFYAPEGVDGENLKEKFQLNRWDEPWENTKTRVQAMKKFVIDHPSSNIAIVGHSSFFKLWLNADSIMPNCHIETTIVQQQIN